MNTAQALLSVHNLSRNFGGVWAVNNVSLEVFPGETTALIGSNGAGKTTFYNMISGRLRPSAGSIRFRNEDITGLPPHRISRLGISRSFQINNIFEEFSVRKNIEVALTALHGKALQMLRMASRDRGLHEAADDLLHSLGLTALADTRAAVLSYGDKRLLEIALVLATKPSLVLLDEPTAGMTPEETHRIIDLVAQLAQTEKYTFFITEHDMNVVFHLARRLFVMHQGELLATGTPEQIRNDSSVQQAYLGTEGLV